MKFNGGHFQMSTLEISAVLIQLFIFCVNKHSVSHQFLDGSMPVLQRQGCFPGTL